MPATDDPVRQWNLRVRQFVGAGHAGLTEIILRPAYRHFGVRVEEGHDIRGGEALVQILAAVVLGCDEFPAGLHIGERCAPPGGGNVL